MEKTTTDRKSNKVNFTAGRVNNHVCEQGKSQSFLWDTEAPGLGLRSTANGAKSYIFQSKLKGKDIRITIGSPKVWSIDDAQKEARRLKVMIDNGQDPRQVKADSMAAAQALAEEQAVQQTRETVTVSEAWKAYIIARSPHWSDLHRRDHSRMMQAGGEERKRSDKLTEPGMLLPFANIRLVDLTTEQVEQWAKDEAAKRPARARLAMRILRAFLTWCAQHKDYKLIISNNPATPSKALKETLGKPIPKDDVLGKEQLKAWFEAVKKIGNPVISAYLQTLLLTGARRNELAALRWEDVDFQWKKLTIKDKIEGSRIIPLTPYVEHLISALPRRNQWVFSSPTAATGHIAEPRIAHNEACAIAGLTMTLHGLRRSFATLCEWTETPSGIAAQIQGHKPQGVREKNYIRRPLDLMRMWHVKIESWILEQAGIEFVPVAQGLRVVTAA